MVQSAPPKPVEIDENKPEEPAGEVPADLPVSTSRPHRASAGRVVDQPVAEATVAGPPVVEAPPTESRPERPKVRNDDGKSMIEKARQGVGASASPTPEQADLDAEKRRIFGGGPVEGENREMQPGAAGNYTTR